MLEGLMSTLRRAESRSAHAVARRTLAICALFGLLAAMFTLAPASAAGGHAQAAPSLDAVPTRSAYFAFAIQGNVVGLSIAMRNTGEGAWDAAQGFRLRRLDKDGSAVTGESYPVEHTVQAGETATWDIVLSLADAGLKDWRYAMFQGERSFGSTARAIVVILPNLEGTRQVFRTGVGGTVQAMTDWATRTFGSGMGGTVQAVTDWASRTFGDTVGGFARSVQGWFRGLSGGFSPESVGQQ